MLYERYKRKIEKVAQFLKTIWKYRIIILSVLTVAMLSTGTFLVTKGIVTDKTKCPISIVYGETLDYQAGGLFSNISYQYSATRDFEEFTVEMPKMPGKYFVRAVSSGSFKTKKYGKVHAFEICKKKVDVSIVESTWTYGDTPSVTANLPFNDRVDCTDFYYQDLSTTNVDVAPQKEAITAVNEKGEDVTQAYDFIPISKNVTLTPRDVTITVGSAEQDYNADSFSYAVYEVTKGNLVAFSQENKDTIVATYPDITNVGSIDNEFLTFHAVTTNSVDVSHLYNFTIIKGTLTINKRPVYIDIPSEDDTVSFVYDGLEHSYTDYVISADTPLVDGHTEVLDAYTTLVNVGKEQNLLTFKFFDENNVEVTDNYCVILSEGAYVEVLQRDVIVTTPSETWVYDSNAHFNDGFIVSEKTDSTGIIDGHVYIYSSPIEITDVSSLENTVTLTVKDENGGDVSANYNVIYTFGLLEVTPRPIAITTETQSWIYDSEMHDCAEWNYTDPNVSDENKVIATQTIQTTAKVSVLNVSDGEIENIVNITIIGNNGKDVTSNYAITYSYGTIKIEKRPVYVVTDSARLVYNAEAYSVCTWQYKAFENGDDTANYELVSSHTWEAIEYSSFTNVDDTANQNNVFSILVYNNEEKDVTENYEIHYEYGTVEIYPRPVYIVTDSAKLVYSANEHTVATWQYKAFDGESSVEYYNLVETHTWKASNALSFTNVEDTEEQNNVFSLHIYDNEEQDVTENYEIHYEYGTVEIYPRPVYVVTQGDSFVYDGEEHAVTEWSYKTFEENDETEHYDLVESHQSEASGFSSFKNVNETAEQNNVFTLVIFDKNKQDVTENYDIRYEYGTVEILKREIHVTTPTLEWIYDGILHELTEWNYANDTPYEIVYNDNVKQSAKIVSFTAQKDATEGSVDNELVLGVVEGDEDVTENYDIRYEYGKITVFKREVSITTPTVEWIYDGTVHELKEWSFAQGAKNEVLSNENVQHTITIESFTAQKDVTQSPIENRLILSILDGDENVTHNYDIHYEYGTINVLKRSIYVQTGSLTTVYDDNVHFNDTWDYVGEIDNETHFGLVEGHGAQSINPPSFKYVTTEENNNVFTIQIFDGDEDVSSNYDVDYTYGTICIKPRVVLVVTESESWVYDDDVHYNLSWTYHADTIYKILGMVEGEPVHTYTITQYPTVQYVTDGVKDNALVFSIFDENNTDVTSNYDVQIKDMGKISITPRPITVTTNSNRWEYNGEEHFDEGFEVISTGALLEGHKISVVGHTTIKEVGKVDNCLTFSIKAGTVDNIENYEIIQVCGTLEITYHYLEIVPKFAIKEYDGTPLMAEDFVVVYGTLDAGHTIVAESIVYLGSQTEIGLSNSEIQEGCIIIVDADGKDITGEYTYALYPGVLEVTKRNIVITAGSDTKPYDGTPLTCDRFEHNDKLLEGHVLYAETSGSQLEIGSSKNSIIPESVAVYDSTNNDVSHLYDFVFADGTLTVTVAAKIKIITGSTEKEYDGTPLTFDECSYEILDGAMLRTHIVIMKVTGTQTDVGSSKNTVEVDIVDENGESVLYLYELEYELGTLTILKRSITIKTGGAYKYYDGTPLTCGEYQTINLLKGHNLTVVVNGSQTEVGQSKNTVIGESVKVYDQNGNDITSYYKAFYDLGWLRVYDENPDNEGGYGNDKPDVNIDTDGDGMPDTNIDTDGDGEADTNIDTDGDGKPNTNVDTDGDGDPDTNVDTDNDGKADTNIDTDGNGEPDINVDTDGDGEPDTNIDTDGDGKPNLDVDTNGDGTPDINVDTDNDGKADTNIDTDGDGIPDKNIEDKTDVDIDTDGDGAPDINVDTDGDGEADTNIDTDGNGKPDVNIDTNGDGTPDTNVDTNNDGKADTNIDTDGNGEPDINVDTDGNGTPDTNIDTNGDGTPDTNIDTNGDGSPDTNVDTDNDGKADTNIDTDGDGEADTNVDTDGDGAPDTNIDADGNGTPDTNIDTDGDGIPDENIEDKTDVDIDTDGDGMPDTNIDTDGDGEADTNIDTNGNGNPDVNIDTNGDGTPDTNVDTDSDGKADTNIDTDGNGEPDTNVDIDGDGEADTNIDTDGNGTPDTNIDTDGDGEPDINVDTDNDGKADTNIDTDGNGEPDINVDTDGNGEPDTNIDTDGDGKPNLDVDTNGDGTPDINVDTDNDGKADTNIDTDGDGIPDKNIEDKTDVDIDTDGDGMPDTNIDTDGDGEADTNIDTDGNGNPDVNIDTNGDGTPDTNVDTNNDGKADTNIDTDGDGAPDINVDTDGDGEADTNIDTDGNGKPNLDVDTNGDGIPDTNVDTDNDGKADTNIDTDGDGEADTNIDTDGDGEPDTNIDADGNGTPDTNIDTDGDGEADTNVDTDNDGEPDTNIDTDGDGTPDTNIDTDNNGNNGGTAGNLDQSGDIGGETVPGGSEYEPGPSNTVLQVKSTASGKIYLRLMSYGDYTGTGWESATPYEQYIIENYGFNYLVALALKLSDTMQLQKLEVKSFTTDYLLPYFIDVKESNHIIQGNDVEFSGTHDGEYFVYYYAYNGDFSGLEVDLGVLSEAENLYRNFVYSQYLRIDDATEKFIKKLIDEQGWSKDDPKIISKVQRYVQNCATYNKMYDPNLNNEENMVVAFLGDDYNEGICRHYAAAATMIFRTLKIPARYTIGYVGETKKDQWTDIKAEFAHAWTEIYIDGIGWIPVEVTGTGTGGNVEGDNSTPDGGEGDIEDDPIGDIDQTLMELEIAPIDVTKAYDGSPLDAVNEIYAPYNSNIERLLSMGYTYEVVVEGSRTEIGTSESSIVSFKLFNPDGINVTDLFTIIYLKGEVKVTNTQVIIVLFDIQKTYDGEPISYNPKDYWVKQIPYGYELDFNLQGSQTEVGEFDVDNLRQLPYIIRNQNGEDVTKNYYLEIEGRGLRVNRRVLQICSASVKREYNGEALKDDTITILLGSLANGHTLTCKVTGTITEVGFVENTIESCVITDKDGKVVTRYYEITAIEGILEIVSD